MEPEDEERVSPPKSSAALMQYLPLCMVSLDPANLHPIGVNAMFERHMGPLYKFANHEFVLAASDDQGSDARARLRAAVEEAAAFDAGAAEAAGSRVRVRNVEMTTLAGKSGFPVRRFFDWFVSRGSPDDGGAVLLLGDPCSERDAAERAKDSDLIDFFQNAPIALHWLSGEGKVLWANRTELNVLGFTEEEYFGQDIMKFCPDDKEIVLEIFKQFGSGNAVRDVPVRFRTKDGRIVHLLIDSNVKYNKDGSFGHTRCFIRDDTGRKIREANASLLLEETKRSLKMLDHFVSRSLHHLRTPLHVTQSMVDGISACLTPSASLSSVQRNECLELCKMATDQISSSVDLISDISDLANYDQGAVLHIHPEIVDLEKFGRDVLDKLPPTKDGVRAALDLRQNDTDKEGPSLAVTDPTVLRRVLRHLLNNAVDNTESGTVALGIGYKNRRLTFTVADTGPGLEMAPDAADGDLPTIFQRYHQEMLPEDSDDLAMATNLREKIEMGITTHKKNGLGIGLSLTYHLVQSLGAELRCHSAKGEGTKFQFSLPRNVSVNTTIPQFPPLLCTRVVRKESAAPQDIAQILRKTHVLEKAVPVGVATARSGSASSGSEPSKKRARRCSFNMPTDVLPKVPASCLAEAGIVSLVPPSILVVEDTKACAKMLCMTLRKFKCGTKWAENGQIAIDILKEATTGTYDLILMDLRMPVLDGLEATKLIKGELKISTPVVALTADDGENIKEECRSIGFDAFHSKPMKRVDLKAVIKKFTGYEVS